MSRFVKYMIGILSIIILLSIAIFPFLKYMNVLTLSNRLLDREYVSSATWVQEDIHSFDRQDVKDARIYASSLPIVGEVAIPDARNLHLPVLEGVTNMNTVVGAATMKPHQEMGVNNYTLGSHRLLNPYALFGPLEVVTVGMPVWLRNSDCVFLYRVYHTERISPYNGWVLDDQVSLDRGAPILTLITCGDEVGYDRRLVQADFVDSWSWDDQPQEAVDAFNNELTWLEGVTRYATYWEIGDDGSYTEDI